MKRLLPIALLCAGFFFYLCLLCGGVLFLSPPIGIPVIFLIMLLYGWGIYAFVQYREGRQQEVTHLLCTAAEAHAPLAPALWAYVDDRPHGTLKEFWTGSLLFLFFPGYYWIWHRRHNFDRKISRVAHHIEMGDSLPQALEASPGVVARGMILAARIGEITGRLAESLRSSLPRRLTALWLEMLPRFLYPLMLVFFIAGLTSYWSTSVLPRLESIYDQFDQELPLATQQLLEIIAFVYSHLPIMLLSAAATAALIALILSSSTVLWYFPLLGRLYRRHQQSNVLKMLSVLLRIQMPAPNAFVLLSQSNYFDKAIRRRLLAAGQRVSDGKPLAESLQRSGLLPGAMVALVQAAERMHNLPWALDELGETLGERTVRTLRRISQVAGPLLVMAVGLLVAVVAVGMFMPVIDIVGRLS